MLAFTGHGSLFLGYHTFAWEDPQTPSKFPEGVQTSTLILSSLGLSRVPRLRSQLCRFLCRSELVGYGFNGLGIAAVDTTDVLTRHPVGSRHSARLNRTRSQTPLSIQPLLAQCGSRGFSWCGVAPFSDEVSLKSVNRHFVERCSPPEREEKRHPNMSVSQATVRGSVPIVVENFPPIVPTRGCQEQIRKLMRGDEHIGRGSKQRGLGRSVLCNQLKSSISWPFSTHRAIPGVVATR